MANILDRVTVGEKQIYQVDADPSAGAGTPAVPGSVALFDTGTVGTEWLKVGTADTAWDKVVTFQSTTQVGQGVYRRVALYDTNPGPSFHLDDQITENGFTIDLNIQAQPTRSAAIAYRIPNPGDAITAADFILSEGAQTKNGNMTFNNDVVVQGNLTVNGTTTTVHSTVTTISDPLITLNQGGGAASGGGSGFEIEEAATITGYFKTTADRLGFALKAPGSTNELDIKTNLLTATRLLTAPDEAGRILIRPQSDAVVAEIPFYGSVNRLDNETGTGTSALAWDTTNKRLGVRTSAPADALHLDSGNFRTTGSGSTHRFLTSSDETKDQDSVSTSDGTTTTLKTIPVANNSMYLIETRITARKTAGAGSGSVGDGASYVRTARVKNIGGTVTIANVQSDYTSEDVVGWNATIDVSGTNARVRVTGSANNTVLWECTTRVQVTD